MAAPLLKKTSAAVPSLRLKASGTAPLTTPHLKNAGGKPIVPKKPAPLARSKPKEEKPADPGPTESAATATAVPVQEAAAVPASEVEGANSIPTPEATAVPETAPAPGEDKAAEETPAEQAPEAADSAEDAAAAAALAEHERQMAEYNRQMEEYNRQMEEYNRQVEEYNRRVAEMQQQATAEPPAAQTETPTVAPTPAVESTATPAPAAAPAAGVALKPAGGLKPARAKTGLAKPAGAKAGLAGASAAKLTGAKPASAGISAKAVAKPGAVAAPEPPAEGTPQGEESTPATGVSSVDEAYLEQLRRSAERPSIWKRKGFWVAVGVFVAFVGVCGWKVMQENAIKSRAEARHARIMALLKRAQKINMSGVESLADAKKKNVDVHCSEQDAMFLMDVVVNPNMQDEKGKPMLGGDPEGVAKLACLLLGITAEENAESAKKIFTRLEKEVKEIKPSLYRWLIQRLAVADIKDVNAKLLHLTEVVSKMPVKGFRNRDEILSYIWETMGLRVTEKDVPMIADLLKDPEMSPMLAKTLSRCLSNVLDLMDDPAKKKELGDRIFDLIPESRRAAMAPALASACSPKALAYYKQEAQDPAKWRQVADFFANFQDDSVVDYLVNELKPKAAGDAKKEKQVQSMLESVVCQNRDRKPEDARKLVSMVYGKIDADTSEWDDVNAKTDPDSAEFVGENSPQYAELMKKREEMENIRKQKIAFVRAMGGMFDWPWVVQYLQELEKKEQDGQLLSEIHHSLNQVVLNRENDKNLREKYKQRTGGK